MKYVFAFIFISVLCVSGYCQKPQLKKNSEELIYSFITIDNKTVVIAHEKQQNYVVFRYGTKDKIEIEVIESKTTADKKFKYSFFSKGTQGKFNYLDLNYLCLNIGSIQYVVFEDYVSIHEQPEVGIIITDANIGDRKEIRGVAATKQGTLTGLKESELIEITTNVYR